MIFEVRQGDTAPLPVTVRNARQQRVAIDLGEEGEALFIMRPREVERETLSIAVDVDENDATVINVPFAEGDLNIAGIYDAELQVTNDGGVKTWPEAGDPAYWTVIVHPELNPPPEPEPEPEPEDE